MKNRSISALLLCLFITLVACTRGPHIEHIDNPVVAQQTIAGIDACQGIFIHEGSVWLYGDKRGKGVVKRLEWRGPKGDDGPRLIDSEENYELVLYRSFGIAKQPEVKLDPDPIPHPTGLTYHRDFDTFIGNTTDQQGRIFHLHFLGFTESGSLDDWISNKTIDDLATNGTRPEFMRYEGQWVIATADDGDQGDQGNQIRLYDPAKLKKANKTSDPGVLVASFDCSPFVKSMHWIDETRTLVLAQNQAAEQGSRLTLVDFSPIGTYPTIKGPYVKRVIDLGQPAGELTGFAIVAPGWAILTSASKENNVSIIRWPIQEN